MSAQAIVARILAHADAIAAEFNVADELPHAWATIRAALQVACSVIDEDRGAPEAALADLEHAGPCPQCGSATVLDHDPSMPA